MQRLLLDMKKNTASKNNGKLRIIGGQWRSRILPVIQQEGLRPTTDRVRETLFNWLQAELAHSYCLDLFAGSGALGFEAASRGAANVVLIESSVNACRVLKENSKTLQADNIQCVQNDAIDWLSLNTQRFDIVFIDPPYASDLLNKAIAQLEINQTLTDNALIYFEHQSRDKPPELPGNWSIIRHKTAGQISYYLAQREPI